MKNAKFHWIKKKKKLYTIESENLFSYNRISSAFHLHPSSLHLKRAHLKIKEKNYNNNDFEKRKEKEDRRKKKKKKKRYNKDQAQVKLNFVPPL